MNTPVTILIVDESEFMRRRMLRAVNDSLKHLSASDWEVLEAEDADEARAAIMYKATVDGLICSHELPGARLGKELLALIREDDHHARLPVLLLTEYAHERLWRETENLDGVLGSKSRLDQDIQTFLERYFMREDIPA